MKKVVIVLAIVITLCSVLLISASAYTIPSNPHSFGYWVVFNNYQGSLNKYLYYYTGSPGAYNDITGSFTWDNGYTGWYSTNSGGTWVANGDSADGSGNAAVGTNVNIVAASYDIGSYVADGAEWITSDYTGSEPPICEFRLKGDLTINDINVGLMYTGLNGVQHASLAINGSAIKHNSETDYYYIDDWSNIPWGYGINTLTLQDLMMETTYDSITLTMSESNNTTCTIEGLEEGASYEVPPPVSIVKLTYTNTVGFYVNGEKYINVKGYTGTYPLYDMYTDNIVLGNNQVYIKDEVTDEIIQTINFSIIRGYIKEDGTYWNDSWNYDGENPYQDNGPSSFENLKGYQPEKPGEGATIIDWITYIGEMIGYVFSIATAAIIEFAKSIGNMLASLFGMIQPILVFIQQMFSALPSPISAGLYALFTLSCVLAILKMLRRS